ncbi:hypothetical protein ACROYT_G000181 [Oculina patagonica]
MFRVFRDIPHCLNQRDDILMGGRDETEHKEVLQQEITESNLTERNASLGKNEFKVRAINECGVPENKEAVRNFLGMAGYVDSFFKKLWSDSITAVPANQRRNEISLGAARRSSKDREKVKAKVPPRIEKRIMEMQYVDYELVNEPGKDNLSRHPLAETGGYKTEKIIREEHQKDEFLKRLAKRIDEGDWEKHKRDKDHEPYLHVEQELSVAEKLIFREHRIALPPGPSCSKEALCHAGLLQHRCLPGYVGDGKINCAVVRLTATSSCANLLTIRSSTSGLIYSNKNGTYNNSMNCQWSLSANANLELEFFRFDTEVNYDFVYVYNGGSSSDPLVGKYNGSSLPAKIRSTSNKLFIVFTTDGSVLKSGFAASYHFADTIRLVGSTPLAGRVEVFYGGQWGTICDHAWDMNDANVVCRQLGFPQASQANRGATHGQGSGPIWMDDVACLGSESYIYECRHRGWGNNDCIHSQDASVQCSSTIP